MRAMRDFQQEASFQRGQPIDRLRTLLQEFETQFEREKLCIQAFTPNAPLADFAQLPLERQQLILKGFEQYYTLCSSAVESGSSLAEGKRLLWRILAARGLRCPSDLLDRIGEDEVIEIYDTELVQIFRNFRFIELCNYAMDRVLSCEWPTLFSRPPAVDHEIFQIVGRLLRGEITGTMDCPLPEYVLQETQTEEQGRFLIHHGIASPLHDANHQVVAFVCTLRAQPIDN
jgi:hypothetical protein